MANSRSRFAFRGAPQGRSARSSPTLVERVPAVFRLGEESHARIEHAVVDHRLDVKDVQFLVDDAAHAVAGIGQRRARVVEVGIRGANGCRGVVRLQGSVVAQSHADGFVAAVHRHEVDVDVDEQVGFRCAAVDADFLAELSFAELDNAAGLFAVVAIEPVGEKSDRIRHCRPPSGSRTAPCAGGNDVAMTISTSVTPAVLSFSSKTLSTDSRMSGLNILGSGSEMSSMAMVTFIPARSCA